MKELKKIAIVGSGAMFGSAARLIVAKAGMQNDVELINLEHHSIENLAFKQLDKLERELGDIKEEYIQYVAPPKLYTMGGKDPKPTCKKHHEYIKTEVNDGNIIHSTWHCRHCNKPLYL